MVVKAETASRHEQRTCLFEKPRAELDGIHVEIEFYKAGGAAFRFDEGKAGFLLYPLLYTIKVFQTDASIFSEDRVAVFQSDTREQIVDFSDADDVIIPMLIDFRDQLRGTGDPAEADARQRECF